jgi:hypothetical protein
VTTRALDGPSYGERTGVTLLIDLFDDGPDIVIKPDFFTAGESARIFEQLKAQIRRRQDVTGFGPKLKKVKRDAK